ncbi:hypothetical protein, partial [Francisella tularensis]|uniref:hypothetical protein n=1 Tax=Francisella tularensis TaxID=263 RepID=UPI002381CC57
ELIISKETSSLFFGYTRGVVKRTFKNIIVIFYLNLVISFVIIVINIFSIDMNGIDIIVSDVGLLHLIEDIFFMFLVSNYLICSVFFGYIDSL